MVKAVVLQTVAGAVAISPVQAAVLLDTANTGSAGGSAGGGLGNF